MGKDLKGKELGVGLSQRKDGSYEARFVNRFGKRDSVYGKTVKEVRNKLAMATAKDQEKRNIVNPRTTLDEWYEKWMEIYKAPVVRPSTKKYYEYIYEDKISPELGRNKLSEITKLQITSVINKIASQGYSWEILNKVKLLLIDMFDKAMDDEFVAKNPARKVRLPINRPQKYAKALTVEDQEDFLTCSAGTFYHNLFVTAINTGLRPGELFALTENDIDFTNKMINVTKTLNYQQFDGDEQKEYHFGPPKTSSSVRSVPMNSTCEEVLRKQIRQHNVIMNRVVGVNDHKQLARRDEFKDIIFTSRWGTPMNSETYIEAIGRIVKEVNLTRDSLDQMEIFSGHTFRHTFATRCFEAGIQPKVVQSYLGHASIQMTMDLYTSVLEQKRNEDIYLLDEYLKKCQPGLPKRLPPVEIFS